MTYVGCPENSWKNTVEVRHRLDIQRERKEQQSFSGIFPVHPQFFQIGYAVGMLRKNCIKREPGPNWACIGHAGDSILLNPAFELWCDAHLTCREGVICRF